jgi:cytochrome bd-type quinol oxidase subunit 2
VTALASLVPVDHFLIMALYALLISVFFALLWRNERRDRVFLFVKLFLALVVGALAVAWLMYPFPK